jgi:hypothetical protein
MAAAMSRIGDQPIRRHPTPWQWLVRFGACHTAILFLPLLMPGLYGGAGPNSVLYDVRLYFEYASQAAAGKIPYRDYTVEYPPLALPLIMFPRLLTREFGLYVVLFAVLMLSFDLLMLYLVARCVAAEDGPSAVPVRLAWYTAFAAALYPMLAARYDLAASAVAFAAAVWWFSGRPAWGAVATVGGMLLKIYPACIGGLAVVYEAARPRAARLRGTLIFVFGSLVAVAAWWGAGGTAFLEYHLGRGLQIETLWAGALMGLAKITGGRLAWSYNHSSVELLASGARALASLAMPAQGAAFLLVVWRFWRSDFREPLRHAGAAVLAFVVCGKVLSPQYLIWLVPFVTVLQGWTGQAARVIFLLACAATTFVYPLAIAHLLAFESGTIAVLNLRNLMLVALFLLLLFGPGGHQGERPRAGRRTNRYEA